MTNKPKVAGSLVTGAGFATALVWIWSLAFPETPLPPEVAAAFAGLLGGVYGPIKRKIEWWLNA